jgi:hypothetical protein
MQRFQTPLLCAGSALLATLLSFGSGPAQANQEDPNKVLALLRAEILELELQVLTCQSFMEQQAAAGKELAEALARSEAEGFTAGINPRSREVLLDGLRAQAKAMQSMEPKDKDKGKAKGTDRRQGRRKSR